MKTIIFLTTQTSGTGSMMRIYKELIQKKYKMIRVIDLFNKREDIKNYIPDKENCFVLLNTPHRVSSPIFNLKDYRYIINIRDPRDRICNSLYWAYQHPLDKNSPRKEREKKKSSKKTKIDCLK